jgi:hypothetical protein
MHVAGYQPYLFCQSWSLSHSDSAELTAEIEKRIRTFTEHGISKFPIRVCLNNAIEAKGHLALHKDFLLPPVYRSDTNLVLAEMPLTR